MTTETGWADGVIDPEEAAAVTTELVACRSYPAKKPASSIWSPNGSTSPTSRRSGRKPGSQTGRTCSPRSTMAPARRCSSTAMDYGRETGRPQEWGYAGFGDANLLSGEAGIHTVQIGPRGANFHQANEWVDVPSIAASARLYVRMAFDLLR